MVLSVCEAQCLEEPSDPSGAITSTEPRPPHLFHPGAHQAGVSCPCLLLPVLLAAGVILRPRATWLRGSGNCWDITP